MGVAESDAQPAPYSLRVQERRLRAAALRYRAEMDREHSPLKLTRYAHGAG